MLGAMMGARAACMLGLEHLFIMGSRQLVCWGYVGG